MSTPRDFMERVVAWPASDEAGYVNLHFNNAKYSMLGRPYRDLDEFMGMAQWGALNPAAVHNIYFCLSTQSAVGKAFNGKVSAARHSKTALKLKAIWLDVDVKKEKGYATLTEALDAINDFITRAALPAPSAIVLSGGGVHVYWISDRALTVDEWRPYAAGLRAQAERYALRCDYGLTTDPARILRVPGTFNHKFTPPKVVRLAALGDSYDFAGRLSGLAALAPKVTAAVTRSNGPQPAPFDLSNFKNGPAKAFAHLDARNDNLAQGINTYDDKPLPPDAIFKCCPHFADAAITHGAGYPQGLWMLDVLGATFMDDGKRWAHYFSKGYVSYSASETDQMYERKTTDRAAHGLGWPSCQAFENEGAIQCKKCPYHGKIRSPLNLAERHQPPKINMTAPPADMLPPEEQQELPDGYTYNADGLVVLVVQEEGENGMYSDKFLLLFQSRLRHFKIVGGTPATLIFETELDTGNWSSVHINEDHLATEQSLMRALRNQGVKPNPDQKRRIEQFMTSFMAKLDREKARLSAVPNGWVHKGAEKVGFSYGGVLMKNDGTTTSAGLADAKFGGAYSPMGSIDPWFEALKVITDQKHPALEAIVALSFAAPLMHSTGLKNAVLHAWSNESGAHKSTSIAVGLAVWANPQLAKENKMTSPKAMLKKLGELKNLPVYWDEINRMEMLKAVQAFLDVATEGRGGLYLTQNREFRQAEEWQSLVGIGANVSLYEYVKRNTKNTDAQLQRVFEIKVEKRLDTANPLSVSRLIDSLDFNYGQMGMKYASMLAIQPPAIDTYVKAVCEGFNKRVDMKAEERFRGALAGTMYAGAALANQLGATFNLPLLYAYLIDEFLKQRKVIVDMTPIAGTYLNTSDALSRFFDSVTRNVLWVDRIPFGRGKPGLVNVLKRPEHDAPVFVRCAAGATPRIQISRDQFEKFLTEEGTSVATVVSGLKQHFGAGIARQSLTSGTNIIGGRAESIDMPAKGGMLYDLVFKHTPPDQRPPEDVDSARDREEVAEPLQDAVTGAAEQAAADQATVDAGTAND